MEVGKVWKVERFGELVVEIWKVEVGKFGELVEEVWKVEVWKFGV